MKNLLVVAVAAACNLAFAQGFATAEANCEMSGTTEKAVIQGLQRAVVAAGGELTLATDTSVSAKRIETTINAVVTRIGPDKLSLLVIGRESANSFGFIAGGIVPKAFIGDIFKNMKAGGTGSCSFK